MGRPCTATRIAPLPELEEAATKIQRSPKQINKQTGPLLKMQGEELSWQIEKLAIYLKSPGRHKTSLAFPGKKMGPDCT